LGAAHIADHDMLVLIDNSPRNLVQGILAPTGSRAVQTLRLSLMTMALCLSDFLFNFTVKVTCLEFLAIARRDRAFQAQI
jgi:hypothetical protein